MVYDTNIKTKEKQKADKTTAKYYETGGRAIGMIKFLNR